MALRVLVTRPEGEAASWLQGLKDAGFAAESLPLIAIGPVADTAAVRQAWASWADWQAVMFVSVPAVRHFFAHRPPGVDLSTTPCWAPGPGTRKADSGTPSARNALRSPDPEAGQFDSEALWAQVGAAVQAARPVLIVRGQDDQATPDPAGQGRDWLSEQLQARGVPVQRLAAYARQGPSWTAPMVERARQAASDGSVWLLSSSQGLQHLQRLLPQQDWSGARALATHPRIGESARAMAWGEVRLTRPLLPDVVASLESWS
ncbi:MAG: uroporphyrinogen-III synthase [Limnohabitans sp.]|nr:uroporphyrinogen-III synthase [Limnohabitans sp.]